MNKFLLPLMFLMCACGSRVAIAQTAPVTDPSKIQAALDFVKADVSSALDGATKAQDQVGITCHQKGLAVLDTVSSVPQMEVKGVASGAQNIRNYTRAAVQAAPAVNDMLDACKPVYDPRQVFEPLLQAIPALAKLF